MSGWKSEIKEGVVKSRGVPVLPIFLLALTSMLIYIYAGNFGNKHMKKAKRLFEEGKFAGATIEAELYLAEEPNALDGLVMLGDCHAALATVSRRNIEVSHKHVCAALHAYKRSLSIRFNNNVNNKVWSLEEQTHDLVDRNGRMYGRCESTEFDGEEEYP